MANKISMKQIAIDKANLTIVIAVSIAVFVTIFSLVASKALLDQSKYQSKVIGLKEAALKQTKTNLDEVKKLEIAYREFSGSQQNTLGGSVTGSSDKDGDNARIILDALPSKYDFPATATSIQKLLSGYEVESIQGTDDEIAQAANNQSAAPQAIEIPFSVAINTPQQNVKSMLELFERSIRPIQVQKIELTSSAGQIKAAINAKTYYLPAKTFNVKNEAVGQKK